MRRARDRAIALALAAAAMAGPAQATILHCVGGPKMDIYWDVAPNPIARFWKDGQWIDTRCSAWNGFNWKCEVTPEIYRIEFYVADSVNSHTSERWEINRSTGAVRFLTWLVRDQPQATEDVRGICTPSAEPVPPPPKF